MSPRSWWKERKAKRRTLAASAALLKKAPLREFVYLDAVSLHSLLVSQKSTILENVSEAITRANEVELKSSVAADAWVAKGEAAARYQTSNSNNSQSYRKAVIQTLFKEFRDLELEFKLAMTDKALTRLASSKELADVDDPTIVEPNTAFTRGTLIEVEVTLAVDPVFKFGTIISESTAMASDYPAMFGAQGVPRPLSEAQPILKILDRFLAGLIPIKATATNHVVAEVGGKEYVVHKDAIEGLTISTLPLQVVGVTEHLGYWKDIRRVLFSDGRYTMLCRVARDGIQRNWTPVKLADLFTDVLPGFADEVSAIQYGSPSSEGLATPTNQPQIVISDALVAYKDRLVSVSNSTWPEEFDADFEAVVSSLGSCGVSMTEQRVAFDSVRDFVLSKLTTKTVTPESDLEARQHARQIAGLALFESQAGRSSSTAVEPNPTRKIDERMIDVEVIAIYW